MDALNYLNNIIKEEGNNPDDWNIYIYIEYFIRHKLV